MAALRSFKIICGPLQLLLLFLLLLQDLAEPFQVQIHGPKGRITAGSRATFRCSASEPFQDMRLKWIKDGERIKANYTQMMSTDPKGLHHLASIVEILLGQGDVKSQLSCQVQYNISQKSQRNFPLGDVLRVPPKMRLETIPPSPVQLNASLMVTCNAEGFYPGDAKLELLSEDAPNRKGMVSRRISNPDGTFSLKSYLEVTATEDKNSSAFLCQVLQDFEPLASEIATLFITSPLKKSENSQQQSLLVLCIALFLSKGAAVLFVSCLFLGKACGLKRRKSPSGTFQEVRQSGTSS
ncbi:tyrosine-protein phosphatase non-receptor type substrate 1-like isoform X2 [Ahaetulla prasina]|uniref:tyrosine-protein phosphatase non-receptor type substrate 1-like isoform X2 n=1 Tax=Ahaetulla prasina TaxID=499056 RepID=UPI0026470030|nr:tyrosine-protein phosphatase non-receptor type substrate 1-like isoform X2 [Ahaetulla prasina]